MSKPRFQIATLWPSGEIVVDKNTGDSFMFPDKQYGTAWLYDGDHAVMGFSIADGSEQSGGRRTILRIVQ